MSNVTVAAATTTGWDHPNIPAAFGISIGAGLATGIGGALVFVPALLNRVPQATALAVSLALSAGVMIYVSFIEIFAKGMEGITAGGMEEGPAAALTTLFFFLGMIFCVLLEVLVHWMSKHGAEHPHGCEDAIAQPSKGKSDACENGEAASAPSVAVEIVGGAPSSSGKGGGEAEVVEGELIGNAAAAPALSKMGLMTALAIAIHNFPEGLATFLATVEDEKLGASLGVAIAIHNIPEGLCVAMPIYYATGSKGRAFFWSLLSGVTEPIGGILGFAALQPVFTDLAQGIVFAMVGGSTRPQAAAAAPLSHTPSAASFSRSLTHASLFSVRFFLLSAVMVFIVCHELLPGAHRYMQNGAKTTAWLMIGMFIMAISLVLFLF